MRLHSLTLEAFGPFPNREHIDFDALDQGILLINGPTGSGKSSLLDAIAFALFGDVPGARKSLRQSLRSHHAEPFAEPSVELEFSVGRARWRVRRSPQWEAPKRRGTGTTTRQASVLLSQWRDGDWHLVSQRIDEAADMMSDTLGMKLDQFAQVVLLPQGEFAQFLRAKPEDRRVLLERLFDVSRFEAVEAWFGETKNAHLRRSEAALERIRSHMTIIDDALARLDEPLELPARRGEREGGNADEIGETGEAGANAGREDAALRTQDVAVLPDRLRLVIRDLTARRDEADEAARLVGDRAERAARTAEDETQRVHQRRRAREAADVLDEWPQTRLNAVRRTLDDAASVAGVLRLHHRATVAARQADEAAQATALAEASLREHGVSVAESGWAPPELGEGWLQEALDALRDAEGVARDVETARARVDRSTTQHDTARQRLDTAQVQAREADESFTRVVDEHRRLVELLDHLPDVSPARAMTARLQRDLARRPDFAHALAEADKADAEAVSAYASAERDVLTLRQARLAGIAGELGGALTPDEPCPVCGSVEHPAPAEPAADTPPPEQIEAAEQHASQADAGRLAAAAALTAARERLAHHDETVAAAHEELRGATDALARAIAAARGEGDPPELRHLARIDAVGARLQGVANAAYGEITTDGETARDGEAAAGGASADVIDDVARMLDDVAATRKRLSADVERASTRVTTHETVRAQALVAASAAEERCANTREALVEAEAAAREALDHLTAALHAVPARTLATVGVAWEPALMTPALDVTSIDGPNGESPDTESPDAPAPDTATHATSDIPNDDLAPDGADPAAGEHDLTPAVVTARITGAIDEVRGRRRLITEVERCQQAEAQAAASAASAAQAVAEELAATGLAGIDAARDLALPDAERARLESTWNDAVHRRAAARTTLDDDAVRIAALTPAADPRRLTQRADVLARRAREATSRAQKWRQTHAVVDSMRHQVADAVRTYLPLAVRAEEMADLAASFTGTGDNTRRMRLTSYVLAAHLETVTHMANERLATMTDGRYQLRYTDERAKGNQRSGLGLLVVDAWTGRSRDTATLSGGEAFMASLALALGLGDTVRADSGGLELHTLFVDEGFGSLDQDTLEQVMEVLDSLREGGRLVGVVSHVTELRARIPTHVEVVKTSEGSSIRTRTPVPNAVSAPR